MRVVVGSWVVGLGIGLSACAAGERPAAWPGDASGDASGDSGGVANERAADDGASEGRPTRDRVEKVGRVTLGSFALAGRVTWAGMSAVGETAAGLVQDGAQGATRAWQGGTKATRGVAKREAEHVKALSRGEEPTQ